MSNKIFTLQFVERFKYHPFFDQSTVHQTGREWLTHIIRIEINTVYVIVILQCDIVFNPRFTPLVIEQ